MPYVPPPAVPPAFPHLKQVRSKTRFGGGLRRRWIGESGNFYEWDYLHGTLERYSSRGRHLGEFDADTGKRLKDADPARRIDV